ncbi:hypothetical protein ABIC55_004452 [Sporosarcina psychrophila]|uniref:Uncharacterized protein n=1 Tax=Sporosarcina psychrophila TaxID=1476 RepID=A0ABV2KH05_SPOPS
MVELSELLLYNYKERGMLVNEEILEGVRRFS